MRTGTRVAGAPRAEEDGGWCGVVEDRDAGGGSGSGGSRRLSQDDGVGVRGMVGSAGVEEGSVGFFLTGHAPCLQLMDLISIT